MTKPASKSESIYKGWAKHTRNGKGPAHSIGGGRAGVNRAIRRYNKWLVRQEVISSQGGETRQTRLSQK